LPTLQADIRRNLSLIKKRDLYDFLELTPRSGLETLSQKAKETYNKNIRLGKKDDESTAANRLSGHAQTIFSSQMEKEKYDNTIAIEAMEGLHGLIEVAGGDKFISLDALDALVRQAIERGVNRDDSRAYIEEYAEKRDWRVQSTEKLPSHDLKLCGFCSTLARSPNDTHCPRCREPLSLPCPRCGSMTPTHDERCSKCACITGLAPVISNLLRAGKELADRGDLTGALEPLNQALAYWPDWAPAREAKQRVEATLQQRESEIGQIEDLVLSRQLIKARVTLEHLIPTWRTARADDLRRRVQEGLDRANDFVQQAELLRASGRNEEALPKYEKALSQCTDLERAQRMLASTPPPPPTGLDVEALPRGFRLRWEAPRDAWGVLRYRVLRKVGGPPIHPGDGTVVAEVEVTRLDDSVVESGSHYHYAIYSLRGKLPSPDCVHEGPFLLTLEVEDLKATGGDGQIALQWRTPAGCKRVEIWRSAGNPPEVGGDSDTVPQDLVRNRSELIDAGLVNETTYGYRLCCVFNDLNGREIMTRGKTIQATPCSPPPRVLAIEAGTDAPGGGISLRWNNPERCAITVLRSDRPAAVPVGAIVSLGTLPTLGHRLTEVGPLSATDPAPRADKPHYLIFSTNRLQATYCGSVEYLELCDLSSSQRNGQLILQWPWPDGCQQVEIFETREDEGPPITGVNGKLMARREGEQEAVVSHSLEDIATGRTRFHVRCVRAEREGTKVVGPGLSIVARVVRSRVLHWHFRRTWLDRLSRLLRVRGGPRHLVLKTGGGLSVVSRLRLVGKVNQFPESPTDGRCLLEWQPGSSDSDKEEVCLAVAPWPDAPRGEVFCRLFAEPENAIRIVHPLADHVVL
jgi:tetratricopeptide (TPR) repeat protein